MITMIAAIGLNNELGKDNDLIWHLPADLKRFKKITTGNTLVMGRKTFESIGKPLPNRKTVIITRDKKYFVEGCDIFHSLEEALLSQPKNKQLFVVGGAEIYKQVMEKNLADTLDITLVHSSFEADVFFPEIDPMQWKIVVREDFLADERNPFNYSHINFEKVS